MYSNLLSLLRARSSSRRVLKAPTCEAMDVKIYFPTHSLRNWVFPFFYKKNRTTSSCLAVDVAPEEEADEEEEEGILPVLRVLRKVYNILIAILTYKVTENLFLKRGLWEKCTY